MADPSRRAASDRGVSEASRGAIALQNRLNIWRAIAANPDAFSEADVVAANGDGRITRKEMALQHIRSKLRRTADHLRVLRGRPLHVPRRTKDRMLLPFPTWPR